MTERTDAFNRYQEMMMTAGGVSWRVASKPGVFSWDRLHPATALLIAHMRIAPADVVLDLGCGNGLIGLAAARLATQGQVHLVDNNVIAVQAAQRTLALNGIDNAWVHISDGAAAVHDIVFDVVMTHLPREREIAHQFIADAAAVLKPGGRLYLAGHNDTGIKPFVEWAIALFGNDQVLAYKKSCRVALCVKDERMAIPETQGLSWREFTAQVGERAYRFASKPGVFSWQQLDDGTRALIETIKIRPGETVLDIGCGCGMIGVAAAQEAAHVCLVDNNCIAVEAARRTLSLNGIANAQVYLSDSIEAVRDEAFDVVVTNPPFHQGRETSYDVAHQFIEDAALVLRPQGRLYVVANRFIRYEAQMEPRFHQVSVAYEDNRFRVLVAYKPRRTRF